MTPRLQLIALALSFAGIASAALFGLGQRAERLSNERDAARVRVEILKEAERIEDETDALAHDRDALRRELGDRLSGAAPN